MDGKTILLNILSIIGYEDDKDDFSKKFFSYIFAEAIAEETSKLTLEQQQTLGKELQQAQDEEVKKSIILKYLSKEAFDKRLTAITKEQFTDYFETIYPTLSREKQAELDLFLSSLETPDDNTK